MKKQRHIFCAAVLATSVLAGVNAQAQTPFSTVTSTIWLDAGTTPNGIKDPGETSIAGVLVSLMNATGDTVLSSTLSNVNGEYTLNNYRGAGTYFITFNFPEAGYSVTSLRAGSNNSLNNSVTDAGEGDIKSTAPFAVTTQGSNLAIYNLGLVAKPDTRTFFAYNSNQSTQWNVNLKAPKTNNTTAEITSVKLFVTDAVYHNTIGIENTSTTSPSTGTVSLGGKVVVQTPNGNITQLTAQTDVTKSANLPVYDGITDFGGTSGASWTNEFASAYDDYTYPSASEANFIGLPGDSVSFPVTATGLVSIAGGGSINTSVTTEVSAGVFVTYTYVPGVILPISLSSFEARKDGAASQLSWTTSMEENNKGFGIERSIDGKTFGQIGFVATKAENGNSVAPLSYAFTDDAPLSGNNIYRLKQTDRDGKFVYTPVRIVNFGTDQNVLIYPNPAKDQVTVIAHDVESIVLYNIAGQKINVPVHRNGDASILNINALNSGLYNVQIHTNSGTITSHRISIK